MALFLKNVMLAPSALPLKQLLVQEKTLGFQATNVLVFDASQAKFVSDPSFEDLFCHRLLCGHLFSSRPSCSRLQLLRLKRRRSWRATRLSNC